MTSPHIKIFVLLRVTASAIVKKRNTFYLYFREKCGIIKSYKRRVGGAPHLELHKRLSILGCAILPVILNLHFFKRDSYIYR